MNSNLLAEHIENCLPQSQCRQCGFDACAPYAQALAAGTAQINLCLPGGDTVMNELAALLNTSPLPLHNTESTKAIAAIDESACIGCTACIKACPVDAIIGAAKFMHSVLSDECTGCGLCLPPCPVDCIVMQPVADTWLPRAHRLADTAPTPRQAAAAHAKTRYLRRQQRLIHLRQKRRAAQTNPKHSVETASSAPLSGSLNINPHDLIANAVARAKAQIQTQPAAPSDEQQQFARRQIAKAQERATYRRALRDVQYGDDAKKAQALAYLREYKAQQEQAKSNS
ncbi:RnfABCDGE type electron transport complex subunit B [Stenoxybacter acetivorans]|uniref:RnfABCDGE type electron transport complex subunit B n=1 Tax=Stenoxybacter acetivorans TaxID=422441 RepID=UPI000561705C|nr:RnfABCDGE type electron transport complex subunit B [Stenoxybacter acetivorans]